MDTSNTITFAALAEPTRLSIVAMLAKNGELAASDISQAFRATPSAISQHLKILREAGLTRMQKHGRQRLYSLNPKPMAEAEQWLHERTSQWNARLDAMEAHIEKQRTQQEEQ